MKIQNNEFIIKFYQHAKFDGEIKSNNPYNQSNLVFKNPVLVCLIYSNMHIPSSQYAYLPLRKFEMSSNCGMLFSL